MGTVIYPGFNISDPDPDDSHAFTLVTSEFSSFVTVQEDGAILVQNVVDRETEGHPSEFTIGQHPTPIAFLNQTCLLQFTSKNKYSVVSLTYTKHIRNVTLFKNSNVHQVFLNYLLVLRDIG